MISSSPQQTLRQITAITVVILLGAASLVLLLNQYTDIDQKLADLYFDPVRQVFPWDRTWFARDFMHGYLKNVIVWFGFLIIAVVIIDLIPPCRRLPLLRVLSPLQRLQLRFLALAASLEPLLVRELKDSSRLHCPIGIDIYGGSAPLLRILDAVPADWQAGRCFPAGHASAGMWLSALAILWLPAHPRKALMVFVAGLFVGLCMGWVQQMRGMHFLSHTLATAWVSTALLLVLLIVFWKPLLKAFHASAKAMPQATDTGGN